jgi:hypothetical protein
VKQRTKSVDLLFWSYIIFVIFTGAMSVSLQAGKLMEFSLETNFGIDYLNESPCDFVLHTYLIVHVANTAFLWYLFAVNYINHSRSRSQFTAEQKEPAAVRMWASWDIWNRKKLKKISFCGWNDCSLIMISESTFWWRYFGQV